MIRRMAVVTSLVVVTACVSGCLVSTLDNVGRAGSEAIIVLGWREPTCTPSKGGANASIVGLKILMGDREIPVLAIRDIMDIPVEERAGVKMPPPLQYRVAVIRIPPDMPPGKTTVRIICDGKELTENGISPIEFEVLTGKGRTRDDLEAMKTLK
ncbi:MAG: hypothetical protein GXP25_25150 [Planctomycetes bacterium]|nr:hypothetical protein [Planctomycetota bacterium]